ncbi:hypothetical protein [Sporosarcina sp. FSL W7-1283]|uniref:hypothetical protein n=1 Tax=Sporosarcina sp. FSL W7-1283 TaxID=2921560 RepID=UPI0030F72C3F
MKVYELMCKLNNKKPSETFKQLFIDGAYQDRVFISDLLDMDRYEELHETVERFLESDLEYDGDEASAWKRFVEYEVVD